MAIVLYDSGGNPGPTLTFTVEGGAGPSAGQQLDVHNNRGGTGADTVFRVGLLAYDLNVATSELRESGTYAMDRGVIQARIVQGLNKVVPASDFIPLGAGRVLPLPDLANDEGVQLEVIADAPIDAGVLAVTINFRVVTSRAFAGPPFLTHAAGQGVVSHLGVGTSLGNDLISISGNVVENPGGVDDQVQIPDLVWDHLGKRYSLLTALLQLNNLDGSAQALGAGEEYIATLSLGAGSVTATKSNKGTGLGPGDRVSPPAGEEVLAYVLRQFDGLINNADITNAWVLGRFGATISALVLTLGRGEAVVSSNLVRRTGVENLTLPDAATHDIYLLSDGTHVRVAGGAAQPAVRNLLVYQATTAGGSITALTDRREYLGPRQVSVHLEIRPAGSALAASDASSWVALPWVRPVTLRFPEPVQLSLDGSGTGAGSTVIEVEYRVAGGGAVTLFTSSGSDDRRPAVAGGASDPTDRSAVPEVVVLPAPCEVRARVVSVPATTAPTLASVGLRMEAA